MPAYNQKSIYKRRKRQDTPELRQLADGSYVAEPAARPDLGEDEELLKEAALASALDQETRDMVVARVRQYVDEMIENDEPFEITAEMKKLGLEAEIQTKLAERRQTRQLHALLGMGDDEDFGIQF